MSWSLTKKLVFIRDPIRYASRGILALRQKPTERWTPRSSRMTSRLEQNSLFVKDQSVVCEQLHKHTMVRLCQRLQSSWRKSMPYPDEHRYLIKQKLVRR